MSEENKDNVKNGQEEKQRTRRSKKEIQRQAILNDFFAVEEKNSKNITVNITTSVLDDLTDFAKSTGKTKNEVVESALKYFMNEMSDIIETRKNKKEENEKDEN